MYIHIITLFPSVFKEYLTQSVIGRALDAGLVKINIVNLRDFTHDTRKTVDDKPYGGGAGMLMKPEPVYRAVEHLKTENSTVILTTPQGWLFNTETAEILAKKSHMIIIAGHYEGVDERIRQIADYELSVGDYILTNGNLPAMVITDAVVRLIPGVLGSYESKIYESFHNNLLEYPQYTRPPVFRGMKVPEILLSGNHQAIKQWRLKQSICRTGERRPDLLKKYLSACDEQINKEKNNECNGTN